MSGPKVVRVVTREEIVAQCEGAMRRVESALADVNALATRVDDTGNMELEKLQQRANALRADLEAGQIQGLRDRISATEVLISEQRGKVVADAQARFERKRDKDRLLLASARTVAAALNTGHSQLAGRLLKAAETGGRLSRTELDGLEGLLREGYQALSNDQTIDSAVDADLVKRLSANVEDRPFATWLSQQAQLSSEDARLRRLMAQLELVSEESAALFRSRAFGIEKESDPSRKALLTDSLVLKLSATVQTERRISELTIRAGAVRRRLELFTEATARNACSQLDYASKQTELEILERAVVSAESTLQQAESAKAADFRRRAVLAGLSKLGYSVNEGMATAWSQQGRIVVGRQDTGDYGVELGATPDGQTLQLRVVASDSPASPRTQDRDANAETTWCTDFSELQKLVGANGGELQVKRAIGVGIEPLRTVDTADIERARIAGAIVTQPTSRRNGG